MEQKKKYDQNADQRKKMRMVEESNQLRQSTFINAKSELLLEGKMDMDIKVEDRLMGIGKMWRDRKSQDA